ncbi:MAG: PD-(D/E)XK nuclease family protein [Planctomycetales bacterium]|nr:PD-(D/E)XK nuclease family protein [Planctomycetales bacterium]MBN8628663.1 PD-(D/E)XK nuclease family protein [Planctomycetota bacterium]
MIGTILPTRTTKPPSPAPPAKPLRDYLSYSAITTYQNCPLRYYFRYVAGLPEKMVSSSLVFGSAVHRAVEHHFNELMAGNEAPTLDAMIGEYDRHWSEADPQTVQFGKDDDVESLGTLATKMFTAFQTSPLAKPVGRIIGVEEELRGSVVAGCPDLLGRIDLIEETTDELVVTDLKTSRSRWSRDQADDSAGQLLLYHELVRNFAPRKRVRLQFAVLTKTKEPAVDLHEVLVDARRIERTKRIVERVWQAIDKQAFYPSPSPMQCPGCSFREQCRAWTG